MDSSYNNITYIMHTLVVPTACPAGMICNVKLNDQSHWLVSNTLCPLVFLLVILFSVILVTCAVSHSKRSYCYNDHKTSSLKNCNSGSRKHLPTENVQDLYPT